MSLTIVRDSDNNRNVHLNVDGSNQLSVKDATAHTALANINTTLTNGNQVIKVQGSDGSTIHGDGNGNVKANIVSAVQIVPHHSANAEGSPTTSLNVKDANISKGDDVISAGAGGLQQVLMYGKKPDGTLQPLETSTDRLLVDVLELAPSGVITTSTALPSVQVCGFDDETSKFKTLCADSNRNLKIMEAPPILESPNTLGNGARINDGLVSGLTDSIDMNGFRSVSIQIQFNADTGQSFDALTAVYIYASYDNANFFNTGQFITPAEHSPGGLSGTYKAHAFESNLGARYLALGGHLGAFNFSFTSIKYVRFNGGF